MLRLLVAIALIALPANGSAQQVAYAATAVAELDSATRAAVVG